MSSWMGEPTEERDGKAKRFFQVERLWYWRQILGLRGAVPSHGLGER